MPQITIKYKIQNTTLEAKNSWKPVITHSGYTFWKFEAVDKIWYSTNISAFSH